MLSVLLCCLVVQAPPQKVTYAAGYIANVQFAPFYVAQQRGYYAEEGLELEMDYTIGPDIFKLLALGKVQFASADPDAFLHAASRGMPLLHVATLYQRYPLALVAREDLFRDGRLEGKRIGISGTYGSSYLALKAMLRELGLPLAKVQVVSIGFTQVSALKQNRVDAVVGYINNEPLRLKALDVDVKTYSLSANNQIPGVGIMTHRDLKAKNPELVEKFLRATFRAVADLLADPRACYNLVVNEVLPELKQAERYESEFAVLQATLPFWRSAHVAANGFGQCDEKQWQNLARHMAEGHAKSAFSSWRKWVDLGFRHRAPVTPPAGK
ncbi:ABC transporter substrate-binding protein [Sulfidibacter corallicola]|uniref:ABC transporter substrate-binding protein n=1 Tax=Sulfidibacter corallicola TaxID=2818388 RepID=A0A8A4TWG2_SULCO|nr:ABC transporter substrate-binding protein [Sulfidibacter corallicola]QTD53830.1 ABC transporter substrate-binding protein [Sulfidibacter corallicola]